MFCRDFDMVEMLRLVTMDGSETRARPNDVALPPLPAHTSCCTRMMKAFCAHAYDAAKFLNVAFNTAQRSSISLVHEASFMVSYFVAK